MRELRCAFTITLFLGGLFIPSAAGAEQAAKGARIGILTINRPAAAPHPTEAFRSGPWASCTALRDARREEEP